jgi:hypothetical protein
MIDHLRGEAGFAERNNVKAIWRYLFGVNHGARDRGLVSSSFLGFLSVFLIFFGFISILI